MAEKHYAFIKNNTVLSNLVFDSENTELANQICVEQGFDNAIWLSDSPTPNIGSIYDGTSFIAPPKPTTESGAN